MTKRHSLLSEAVSALTLKPHEILSTSSQDKRILPSVDALAAIVADLQAVIFPGYYGPSDISSENLPYYIGATLDRIERQLTEQICRGYCLTSHTAEECTSQNYANQAQEITSQFITKLPQIRQLLLKDVQAAFDGDPAAQSLGEIIFSYPSIRAMTNHRIAHELYKLKVQMIPRFMSEMAHATTGIDIHPGASIGESFFIDHGTGTVIGETCIIGNNVRIYQGVTLGAKSFPKGKDECLIKGLPRHPIVENDVIVYAGATILGRITIGEGSVIGGNVWITKDVAAQSRIVQSRVMRQSFIDGSGI